MLRWKWYYRRLRHRTLLICNVLRYLSTCVLWYMRFAPWFVMWHIMYCTLLLQLHLLFCNSRNHQFHCIRKLIITLCSCRCRSSSPRRSATRCPVRSASKCPSRWPGRSASRSHARSASRSLVRSQNRYKITFLAGKSVLATPLKMLPILWFLRSVCPRMVNPVSAMRASNWTELNSILMFFRKYNTNLKTFYFLVNISCFIVFKGHNKKFLAFF